MRLFDRQRAPNPRRVHWCMAEKGIVDIDFARMIKFRPHESLAHVARWADAMRQRPAAGV